MNRPPAGHARTVDEDIDPSQFLRQIKHRPLDGFSISNIHGALGDGGQNYKSLVYLLKNFATTSGYSDPTIVHGCAVPGA